LVGVLFAESKRGEMRFLSVKSKEFAIPIRTRFDPGRFAISNSEERICERDVDNLEGEDLELWWTRIVDGRRWSTSSRTTRL
jgi:hypothetical protein